jgi:hypothetical protein
MFTINTNFQKKIPKIYFSNIHNILKQRSCFIENFSRIFLRGLSPLFDQKTPYIRGDTGGGAP